MGDLKEEIAGQMPHAAFCGCLAEEAHPQCWEYRLERAEMGLAVVQPEIQRARAAELREAAEETIAEMVCCDEYEVFKRTGRRPKYPHHICYWGSAHAEALLASASEIEEGVK